MLERLKSFVKKSEPVPAVSDEVSKQKLAEQITALISGQNREYRRLFKRQNGISIAGSKKPVINTRRGK